MSEELKPCPFCGSPAELDTRQFFRHFQTGKPMEQVSVYCTSCSANVSWHPDDLSLDREETTELVVAAWNTRTTGASDA